LEITAQVAEADVGRVALNQTSTVTAAANPSTVLSAYVAAIDPIGHTTNGQTTYAVTLALDGSPPAWLEPGMSATVMIVVATYPAG
jgi:HlyD family secretion protein